MSRSIIDSVGFKCERLDAKYNKRFVPDEELLESSEEEEEESDEEQIDESIAELVLLESLSLTLNMLTGHICPLWSLTHQLTRDKISLTRI